LMTIPFIQNLIDSPCREFGQLWRFCPCLSVWLCCILPQVTTCNPNLATSILIQKYSQATTRDNQRQEWIKSLRTASVQLLQAVLRRYWNLSDWLINKLEIFLEEKALQGSVRPICTDTIRYTPYKHWR
jgi:hypothetical protein